MIRACKLCEYSFAVVRSKSVEIMGYQCRRRIPTVTIAFDDKGNVMNTATVFPYMTGDDWCGEFMQMENAKP